MSGRYGWTAAALLVAACGVVGSPVPVRGNIDQLIGEWAGDYTSTETGRSGSILFTLTAGRDTAVGDVLMIPTHIEMPTAPIRTEDPAEGTPRLIKISFVRCEGNEVTGWLEPYPDPDTGERTSTTFEGVINGDRLEGKFVSYPEPSGRRRAGTWSVLRKKIVAR